MSAALMGSVFGLPLPAQRKLVLLALADNANDEGRCWPSQPTIARKASLSVRALRDHLHALEADGWIAILALGNGRGKSTEYLLAADRIKAEASGNGKGEKAEAGALKAEAHFLPTIREPSFFQPSDPEVAQAPAEVKPSRMVKLTEEEAAAILVEYRRRGHRDVDGAFELCKTSASFRFGNRPVLLRQWLERDLTRQRGETRNGRTQGRALESADHGLDALRAIAVRD